MVAKYELGIQLSAMTGSRRRASVAGLDSWQFMVGVVSVFVMTMVYLLGDYLLVPPFYLHHVFEMLGFFFFGWAAWTNRTLLPVFWAAWFLTGFLLAARYGDLLFSFWAGVIVGAIPMLAGHLAGELFKRMKNRRATTGP